MQGNVLAYKGSLVEESAVGCRDGVPHDGVDPLEEGLTENHVSDVQSGAGKGKHLQSG